MTPVLHPMAIQLFDDSLGIVASYLYNLLPYVLLALAILSILSFIDVLLRTTVAGVVILMPALLLFGTYFFETTLKITLHPAQELMLTFATIFCMYCILRYAPVPQQNKKAS